MNKERLELLAAHLEKLPKKKFDMWAYCGTACCIAGHAHIIAGGESYDYENAIRADDVFDTARDWLGLSYGSAKRLFLPHEDEPYKSTPQQAASVVRHLKDTGKVEWEKFL